MVCGLVMSVFQVGAVGFLAGRIREMYLIGAGFGLMVTSLALLVFARTTFVVVALDCAWPIVVEHLATLTPGKRVFRGVDRWKASDYHRERCRVLGHVGYRLHDARHHWAVRMVRAGMPL